MEQLTQLIKTEIKKQFKSVRKFSIYMGIPQTTIASTLKNGVSGTAYETIVKICEILNIKLVNYSTHIVINDETLELINKVNELDEMGKHTIEVILEMEHQRCLQKKLNYGSAVAFSGKKFESVNTIQEQKSVAEALHELKK